MLLVIFGAGATYDSWSSVPPGTLNLMNISYDRTIRPPLAKDLFSPRPNFRDFMQHYPKCFDVLPSLEGPPANSTVEHELEKIQASGDYEASRQLASIRFYLRDIIWDCVGKWRTETRGASNYKALLNYIRAGNLADSALLVSFNYDLMLEDALRHQGKKIRSIGEYVDLPYRTIKLHGSVNWAHPVSADLENLDIAKLNDSEVAQVLIRHANMNVAQNIFQVLDPPASKEGNTVFVPALAIPTETKRSFECPEEHIDLLTRCLPKVTHIMVVGWAANEKNFLELLHRNLRGAPRFVIVSGSDKDGKEVEQKMKNAGIPFNARSYTVTQGGFSNFVREGAEEFLEEPI